MPIQTPTKFLLSAGAVLAAAIVIWLGVVDGRWGAERIPVSAEQFDNLKGGLSYDEVAAAFGSPGARQPDTGSGGVVFAWPLDNGTTGRIIFVDGKATWKSRPRQP